MVLGADTVPIKDIILEQILQIDPTVIARYTTVQDQLLYLILIPHLIIIIFLYLLSSTVTPTSRVTQMKNMGIMYLIAIVGYIFIIMSGWYGILIPILNVYWVVLLGIGLITFIASKFYHPVRAGEMFGLGKMIGEKTLGKAKARKEYENRIKEINDEVRVLKRELARTKEYSARSLIRVQISELVREKAQLERKKRAL